MKKILWGILLGLVLFFATNTFANVWRGMAGKTGSATKMGYPFVYRETSCCTGNPLYDKTTTNIPYLFIDLAIWSLFGIAIIYIFNKKSKNTN